MPNPLLSRCGIPCLPPASRMHVGPLGRESRTSWAPIAPSVCLSNLVTIKCVQLRVDCGLCVFEKRVLQDLCFTQYQYRQKARGSVCTLCVCLSHMSSASRIISKLGQKMLLLTTSQVHFTSEAVSRPKSRSYVALTSFITSVIKNYANR